MLRLLLLPVCIVMALWCQGQLIEPKVLHKYTQSDNLSSYNIRKIGQDKQGFIWIATQDGLNRFDGNQFDIFKKNATGNKALLGVDIRDIIIDSTRNLVWVLSGQGGLNAIDPITGTVVRSIPIYSAGHEDWNISMTMTNGAIWIGSYKGVKVFDLSQEKLEDIRDISGRTGADSVQFEARHITMDGYGNIWAAISGYGFAIFDGTNRKFIHRIPDSLLKAGMPSAFFRCFGSVLLKDGSILFATSVGLRKVIINRNDYQVNMAPCQTFPEINTELVYSVSVNYRGEIIVSTTRGLLVFDSQLKRYRVLKQVRRKGEADWFNSVFCNYADRNNNLWLGCNEGLGYVKYRPEPLSPVNYDPASNLSLEHVHSIYPASDSNMLVGLKNGLMLVEQERSAFHPIDTANLYHHIYKDPKGVIHAVHSGGMLVYKNKKLLPVTTTYPELATVAAYPVNSHLLLGDSLVILGTENDKGIICWNLHKKTVRTIDATTKPLALAANIVNGLYRDSSGNIWVLADKAITIISPGFEQSKVLQYHDTVSGQPLNIYFDMCEANGSYWVAAYGTGIVKLDSSYRIQRIISSKDGLSNDGVYKIFCPDGKKLIVTSNNGLSMVDLSGFRFSNFFENDGLHNNAFEEASGCMQNGIIYAGGLLGLTIINYRNFLPDTMPPVLHMRSLHLETSSGFMDTSHLFLKKMLIPNDVLQATVFFSAQNYGNPSRTTFYYMINELHQDWIYNGTQNFVNLIGINPGAYTLRVRAVNEDGVSSAPIELRLVFLPKWYQTIWFKILAALTFVASIYGLYRMRMAQLRREERIRRNIAGDLHDDLGSTLNSIKIFTNLALMKPDNNFYLQQAKAGVQNAIAGIRDMVWVLDDRQDTIRHLIERSDQFISPLAAANGIRVVQSIQPSLADLTLGKEEKRNLYLIIKEAVNNSIKYAAPTTIELKIKKDEQGAMNISISDDGEGFNATTVKKGNGLDNMTLRANQIKYDFSLHTSPGKGTTVLLRKIIPSRYRF